VFLCLGAVVFGCLDSLGSSLLAALFLCTLLAYAGYVALALALGPHLGAHFTTITPLPATTTPTDAVLRGISQGGVAWHDFSSSNFCPAICSSPPPSILVAAAASGAHRWHQHRATRGQKHEIRAQRHIISSARLHK